MEEIDLKCTVFNKQIIEQRFSKAANTYNNQAKAQKIICQNMLGLLKQHIDDDVKKILEVGAGTGIMTRLIIENIHPDAMIINDLCHNTTQYFCELKQKCEMSFMLGDAETIDFPKGMDMIIGCSCIQWFNDIPAFFDRSHDILTENGLLAITTFSNNNLKEFSEVTGNGIAYASSHQLKEMISSKYEILHFSQQEIEITFDTPYDILRHLKQTGVTGTCNQSWTKGKVEAFCREYSEKFSTGSEVRLTYSPIYIIARKR